MMRCFQFLGNPRSTETSTALEDGKESNATGVTKTPTNSAGIEKLGSQQDFLTAHP